MVQTQLLHLLEELGSASVHRVVVLPQVLNLSLDEHKVLLLLELAYHALIQRRLRHLKLLQFLLIILRQLLFEVLKVACSFDQSFFIVLEDALSLHGLVDDLVTYLFQRVVNRVRDLA